MSSGEVSKADSPKSGDTATEDRQVTIAAEQVTSSQENTECNMLDISQSHASEGSSSDATDINKASTSDSDSQSVSCSSTIPENLARTGSSIPTLTSTTRQPKAPAQRKSNNTVGQNTVKQGNAAIQNFVQNVTQRQNMMANMPLGVPGNMGHIPVRGGPPAGVTSILGPVPRTLGPPPNFGARPPGFGSNMMNIPAGNFGVQAGNNMFGNTSGTIGSGFGTSCGFNNPAIGQMACGPRLSPFNNSSFPNTIRPGAQMIPSAPNRGPTAPCVTGIGQQPMINLPNLNQPPPGYMPQVQHPRQLHSPRRSRSRDRSPYRRRRRSRSLSRSRSPRSRSRSPHSRSRSPRSRSRSWGRRSYSRDRSLSRGRSYNRDRSLSYERSPRRGSPNRVWSPRPKVRSRSRDRSTSRSPDFRHRLWSRSRSRSRSQPPREDYALSPRFGSSHGSSRPKKLEDDYAIGDKQYRVGGWLRKQHHSEDYTMDSRSANPSYGRSDMRAVRHQLSSSEQSDDKSDALRVIRAKMKIKGKATPDEAQRSVVNCLYELLGRGGSASSSSTRGAVPTGSGERSSSSVVHHAESSIYNPPSKQHHTQINTVSNSTDIFALFTEAPPELKGKQTATGMKADDSYFDKPHSTRDDDRPYSLERDDQVSSTTPAANPSVDLGSTSVSRDAHLGSTSKVSISSPSDKPPVLRATSSAMDDLDSCNYARTKNSIDFMSMVSKLASKPPTRLHRTLSDPPDPDRWFRLSHQDEIQLEERKKQSANAAFLHTVLTELFGSTPRLARALADEKFTKLVPAMERIIKNENIANKDKVKMLTVIVKNAREAMHL